jgi:predicted kinase
MMADRGSLIIMVGLPGSGKSTLAEIIAGYIPQRTVEILNGDRINRELNPVPSYSREELLALHEFIQKKVFESLLVGHVVIYDATNILEKYRKAARQIALRANVNYLIVEVVADQKLIEQRLRSRTSDPQNYSEADLSIYQRMKERFEPILDEHITVQSSEDNFANLDVLLRRIQSLIEEK